MKLTPEQLGRWFRIAATNLLKLPEGSFADPDATGQKAKSVSGLKNGINDLLTIADHGGDEPAADRALQAAGVPTIEEMRASLRRKEAGILRRGVIRDDEEYYIVQEVLTDLDSGRSPKTIRKLGDLAFAYEKEGKSPNRISRPGK